MWMTGTVDPGGGRGGPVIGNAAPTPFAWMTYAERLQAAGIDWKPRRGSLTDIEHVVLLMQENRSFDHYFGTLSGVRGFADPDALTLDTGRSVFYQPDAENPKGYLLPFRLDTRTSSAQAIPSTSHAWSVQHDAWNGGRMDRWLPARFGG